MSYSHDQNFKNLILDYPRQALEFFAAEEAISLDQQARILPIRQEQLKQRLGDRYRELDVPILVEWPDGSREALLFVLEEDTDPSRFSIRRLAHYCLDLTELYNTDRVVPVVIFLRPGSRAPKQLNLGGNRHTYLTFHYLSCDLSELDANHYLDSPNLVARLNLPNMRWAPEQKVDIYAHAMRGLFDLEPDTNKQLKYVDFIDIYTDMDNNQMHEYQERYPQENSKMAGLTERLLNEGMQKGMQQGMQQGMQKGMKQGRQEGEQNILQRQLVRRFGPLDAATQQRLQQATSAELERWSDNILDAETLEDVFTV